MSDPAKAPAVLVLPSEDAVARHVATALLGHLRGLQFRGVLPEIALTGGTIADRIHREVARLSPGSGVDWRRVEIYFGDERYVASDSPDRNAGQAHAAFLDEVGATRVHEMPATDSGLDVAAAAAAYGDLVRGAGGGRFDIVMLGIGPDGHCASLFPGFPQVDVDDAIAVPVTGSPKPPPERISLSVSALSRTSQVWFLASGDAKADAVGRALAADGDVHETPARAVHGQDQTLWFLDAAAAALVG